MLRWAHLLLLLVAITISDISTHSADLGSHNLFTADVYKELKQTHKGNFAVCPLSAQIILALVHSGAQGQTAQELSTALHLSESKEVIQAAFKELITGLHGNEKNRYTLDSANKVYVKEGYHIKDSFKKTAEDVFKAEIGDVNFENRKEAIGTMNKWVEDKTHDKIKNLVSENDINKYTRSVLITAMFFEARWQCQFLPSSDKSTFYANGKTPVELEMIHDVDDFNYYISDDLNAKFLELPYEGGEASMTFVLPNKRDGLASLEEKLDRVLTTTPNYNDRKLNFAVPKFTSESSIKFDKILKSMGVHRAFTDDAELFEILQESDLKIANVIQKTYIKVNEAGTIAAASTAVPKRVPVSGPVDEFIADHPFLYFIKVKDIIVFVGRYVAPSRISQD